MEALRAPLEPSPLDPQRVRLRTVAFPVEHGGWGMLGEPLLLGLLIAPTWAGLGVALAAVGAFLARHPLRIALGDWRHRRRTARTGSAVRFVLLYSSLAVGGLALASRGAAGWWWALVAAAPLGVAQLVHDMRNRGRLLLPEVLGGCALGSIAAAELRAAGWSQGASFAAWAILAAKTIGAILYVRARLRCDRGVAFDRRVVFAAHGLALLAMLALAWLDRTPWLAAAALALLSVRAIHGLSRFHTRVRPQAVGLTEMAYGFAFVVATALGYALRL